MVYKRIESNYKDLYSNVTFGGLIDYRDYDTDVGRIPYSETWSQRIIEDSYFDQLCSKHIKLRKRKNGEIDNE